MFCVVVVVKYLGFEGEGERREACIHTDASFTHKASCSTHTTTSSQHHSSKQQPDPQQRGAFQRPNSPDSVLVRKRSRCAQQAYTRARARTCLHVRMSDTVQRAQMHSHSSGSPCISNCKRRQMVAVHLRHAQMRTPTHTPPATGCKMHSWGVPVWPGVLLQVATAA